MENFIKNASSLAGVILLLSVPLTAGAQSSLNGIATITDEHLEIQMTPLSDLAGFRHAFINSDNDASTGFGQIGADFMIENSRFFRHNGPSNTWSWSAVNPQDASLQNNANSVSWTVLLSELSIPTPLQSFIVDLEDNGVWQSIILTIPIDEPGPDNTDELNGTIDIRDGALAMVVNHQSTPSPYRHAFIDSDNNAATGYSPYGADYLVENQRFYSYDASQNGSWGWTLQASTGADGFSALLLENKTEWLVELDHINNVSSTMSVVLAADGLVKSFALNNNNDPSFPPSYIVRKDDFPADDGSIFANPDRGWWRFPGSENWPGSNPTIPEAPTLRPETITLSYCPLLLESDWTMLELESRMIIWNQRFSAIRALGQSCIVRVVYKTNDSAPWGDANLNRIKRDVRAIGDDVLALNQDVISFHQAGAIGRYGEWYYTEHFGDRGSISSAEWDRRAEVVSVLLDAIGGDTPLALRAPRYKRELSKNNRLSDTQLSRLGFFNDCFTSSPDDLGTFGDSSNNISGDDDRLALAQWTENTPMGGEACDPPSNQPATCERVLAEAEMFHFTYMGVDYHRPSIGSWGQSCHDELSKKLGYRLLIKTIESEQPWTDNESTIDFQIENTGFAAPAKNRSINFILENQAGHSFQLISTHSIDMRDWKPGSIHNETMQISTTGLPAGEYSLIMAIVSLERPFDVTHSIQMANAGLFDQNSGFHDLGYLVTVE